MSTNTRPTINLESWDDGRQPTRAVAAAALLLGDADTTDATCYGWVPQAHAALAAALDVEEMARAIQADQTRRHLWSSLRWEDLEERHRDAYRRDARATRAALLGEEVKSDA